MNTSFTASKIKGNLVKILFILPIIILGCSSRDTFDAKEIENFTTYVSISFERHEYPSNYADVEKAASSKIAKGQMGPEAMQEIRSIEERYDLFIQEGEREKDKAKGHFVFIINKKTGERHLVIFREN